MDMSDKTIYKYTCKYCNKQWELPYEVKHPKCYVCNDENIKYEEIKRKEYYGDKKTIEFDYDKIYWRD